MDSWVYKFCPNQVKINQCTLLISQDYLVESCEHDAIRVRRNKLLNAEARGTKGKLRAAETSGCYGFLENKA